MASTQPGRARLVEQYVPPPMQEIANYGLSLSAPDYIDALTAVRRVERQLWNATRVFPDEIAGQAVGLRGHAVFTAFVNLVGAAGINLPCGQSTSGLPIGLQLIGPPVATAY